MNAIAFFLTMKQVERMLNRGVDTPPGMKHDSLKVLVFASGTTNRISSHWSGNLVCWIHMSIPWSISNQLWEDNKLERYKKGRFVTNSNELRRRGIEPRPHPWKGRILTIRPTALNIRRLVISYHMVISYHIIKALSIKSKIAAWTSDSSKCSRRRALSVQSS